MNLPFYTEFKNQPDLQDVLKSITPSLQLLENLQIKLKNLSSTDFKNENFAEIEARIDRLINKHFSNLITDYAKLSLEYRNKSVIKHENINGKRCEYTSKDIFLKNLEKLIEEIQLLEQDFNHNYSDKLLVQNRIVKDLGLQKNIIMTENEIENVKPVHLTSNFDYEIFQKTASHDLDKKVKVESKIEVTKTKKQEKDKKAKDYTTIVALSLTVGVFVFSIAAAIMEDRTPNYVASTVKQFNNLQQDIKSQYPIRKDNVERYKDVSFKKIREKSSFTDTVLNYATSNNIFGGQMIVMPETINVPNDGFSIAATSIPKNACSRVVSDIFPLTKDSISVNDNIVSQNGRLNIGSLSQACSLAVNTVKLISK